MSEDNERAGDNERVKIVHMQIDADELPKLIELLSNPGELAGMALAIARMEARAHTARLAYYDAAARMLAGKPFKTQAAIAKMVAGEAAMDNARDATQVFGGYGFINEFTVARHYRDSKILEVGEGTTEVQLMLIARELGL